MKKILLSFIFCFFIFSFQSDAAMTVKLNNAPLQFSISDPRVIWLFNRGEEIDVGGLSNNFYSVTYKGQKGYLHKNYLSQFSLEEYENLSLQFNNVFKTSRAEKAQIAIIKDGEVAGGYAYNCKEDDKFDVHAISKTVLGIIAAKMDQEGVVDLDIDIGGYWRNLAMLNFDLCSAGWKNYLGNEDNVRADAKGKLVQNPATLRDCLRHSSTIKDGYMQWSNSATHSGEYFGGSLGTKLSMATFMLSHTSNQLFNPISEGAPGTRTEYNKDNDTLTREHALAGYTMQVAARVTINEYLKTKIFAPMGLSTTAGFREGHSICYAMGYQSSANDLASIIALVANGGTYNGVQILDSNAIHEIEKPEPKLNYQTIAFNYNNGKFERDGKLNNKDGKFGMYSNYIGEYQSGLWHSYVSYDPKTKSGFVVTAYGTNCDSESIYNAARNYVYAF